MSVTGITSIGLFAPIVASNAIFSARRANRGIEAMENDPALGIANMNIAAAQVLKGGRAAKSLAMSLDPKSEFFNYSSKNMIKNQNPLIKNGGKYLNVIANNINPVIVGTSALNVATSENKLDTWAEESTSLLTMFAAEEGAKNFIGMPSAKSKNNNFVAKEKTGYYKQVLDKVLTKEQNDYVQNLLKNNKTAKFAFNGGKGLIFAGASIAGYKLGNNIAKSIINKEEKVA